MKCFILQLQSLYLNCFTTKIKFLVAKQHQNYHHQPVVHFNAQTGHDIKYYDVKV